MSVVMITGCSRPTGSGQLTALAFAKAGHQVYTTMHKPERGAAGASRSRRGHHRWHHLAMEPVPPIPPEMCRSVRFQSSISIRPSHPRTARPAPENFATRVGADRLGRAEG